MTLRFDPKDPFPLLPIGSIDYVAELEHAREADRWLGLRVAETESTLSRSETPAHQELWIGLQADSLQTPYTELRQMLAELALSPGSTVADLGAGYGRMGFVIGEKFPDLRFVGFEMVAPRFREAQRCLDARGYPDVKMELADVASAAFRLPVAEAYFLYDFGSRPAVSKILEDIRQVAAARRVQVIGRGRRVRDLIEREHPWLSQVVAPRHRGRFTIYESSTESV